MAEPIASETRLERHSGTLWRNGLDGVLVFAPGDNEPLHITTPGDAVWSRLAEPVTLGELIAGLASSYGTAEDVVRADIEPVVAALLDAGALRSVRSQTE